MTEHEANPQAEALRPQGPGAKQIAKEVLAGINPIPHGEAISSLEYLAQIRGTVFTVTEGVVLASAAWITTNLALYLPFIVRHQLTVKQFRLLNGATVSGNVDLGIYSSTIEGIPSARQVSTGSTAQAGTNGIQSVNIAATSLSPGLYYMAVALDNLTGTVASFVVDDSANHSNFDRINTVDGVFQEASAFPLPSTATPILVTGGRKAPLMYVGRHQF